MILAHLVLFKFFSGAGVGEEPPEPVVETPMYWGLLRKKKKQPEVEEQLVQTVETEELELAETQSAMQLALQKAMVRKQSERQLDQFIETLAQKAGREKLEKEQREDQEIAAIFAMLI